MLYISENELFANLSERDLYDLTDNLEPAAKTALLESVNDDAVGLIHGYLRGRYVLPVATPDALLKGLVKSIMKYYLFKRRDELNVPETLIKQHAQTLETLKNIQKGIILLDAQKSATNPANQGGTQILFGHRDSIKTQIF